MDHVQRGVRTWSNRSLMAITLAGTVVMVIPTAADDWPQWRGAARLGVWEETGIVDELPDDLIVKWRTTIRSGFSGPP